MTLNELAIKHNTDKSSLFHNYAIKYDRLLSEHRNSFEKVLEIGVHYGASLKMWKDYFQNGTIYGLDIVNKKHLEEERIITIQGDQGNPASLNEAAKFGPFDLIIDDGSHLYHHQIISFENLFDAVKPGGFYIIEDVCTSYWTDWGFGKINSAMDYFKSLIDDVNYYGIRLGQFGLERNEVLLDTANKQKFQIYSIQFFNSTICIQKKYE